MADITMPKMGFDMEEGTIVRWLKQVGDEVKKGEPIAEIETDKVTFEIEAFESGTITELVANEGDVVPVGEPIARLGTAVESAKEAQATPTARVRSEAVAEYRPGSATKKAQTEPVQGSVPYIGIDFGTTKSTMAWYNPKTGQAELIYNAEGEQKTPSVVYYGETETLVGTPAEHMLEDAQERKRVVISVKRDLVNRPMLALPGKRVTAVEVAAEILHKLKHDAEQGHFHQEVSRAVITYPAEFDTLQREKIEEAASLAGFGEVVLLEEPVAAALAYTQAGLQVGEHVLVYDLGGGTFDLAVLTREEDGSFRLALEPQGLTRCGGDDFDQALYDYCEAVAQRELGQPISRNGTRDLYFLRQCRQRKEHLSARERAQFSSLLTTEDGGVVAFKHSIERARFEALIGEHVERTVRLTQGLVEEAGAQGYGVDTVVLIGGSTRVPLVGRMLQEALPLAPRQFDRRDYAVALGAAYYAHQLWPPPTPAEQYRQALEAAWKEQTLTEAQVEQLSALVDELGLSTSEAQELERAVLGELKEAILTRQRRASFRAVIEQLQTQAPHLHLGSRQATIVERALRDLHRAVSDASAPSPIIPVRPEALVLLHTLTGHSDGVSSIAFSPDGQLLASGSTDKTITLWDLQRGTELRTLTGHLGWVYSIAFSPDGQVLASGSSDKTITLWDLQRGTEVRTLVGHSDEVWSIAFSPDGQLLASGSQDKTIKLWDLQRGTEVRTLTDHSGWVYSIAFSPDGQLLASGSSDKTIKLWGSSEAD